MIPERRTRMVLNIAKLINKLTVWRPARWSLREGRWGCWTLQSWWISSRWSHWKTKTYWIKEHYPDADTFLQGQAYSSKVHNTDKRFLFCHQIIWRTIAEHSVLLWSLGYRFWNNSTFYRKSASNIQIQQFSNRLSNKVFILLRF